ncbi:MAG: sporulation integral membrane protein YtvI [Acetivibrionales bacterium]|jgi:sporulation integral membrane protein YtvI|nr:sporulation integral membrane protein YtvI [Clostridiaceae bacterium]
MSENVKRTFSAILKVLLIILGILLFTKIWKLILPFLIAYFFASLIEPVVKFCSNKLKIPRKIGTVISMLIVLGIILSILGFLVSRLVIEIKDVYNDIEINAESLTQFFESIVEATSDFFIKLPVPLMEIIDQSVDAITGALQGVLKSAIDFVQTAMQLAMNIPQVLIFIIVTLVATYFMSSDKDTILNFLDKQIPASWLNKTKGLTKNVFSALFGWLRAQLIMTSITFMELLIAFIILKLENPLLIALLIALVDVLPILGAGTVLLPWSAITLIMGNLKLALSLVLLYLIIILVRQFIEPRVLGTQIGIHPLFTLSGMYIGLKLWGVGGMFLGPILIVIIKLLFSGFSQVDSFKKWIEFNFGYKSKAAAEASILDQGDASDNQTKNE